MNLSALAMKYRPVVYTLVGLLTAWGIFTFFTMPRREDPQYTVRTCIVATSWPGTPAIRVEELITDKLEERLETIEELDYLESETTVGQSVIYVHLDNRLHADEIEQVWDKVRARVGQVPMPAEGIRPIVNDEFGDTAILLLGIYQVPSKGSDRADAADRYSSRELEIQADKVRDVIRLLPGVAKVEKYGVQEEAIYIETDVGNWSQLGLSTSELRELIAERNIALPGGIVEAERGRFNVEPLGEFQATEEINRATVGVVGNGRATSRVRLSDVGLTANRTVVDPPNSVCRFTDESGSHPAVLLALTMKSGENIIDVCDSAMQRIDRMVDEDQSLPPDLRVTPVSKLADNVSVKINDVIMNVVSAIVIVVIVVFLFVGLRTSLVMAANIPFVVLGAIAIIRLFGVELEQISLASIIIALGLLVDNAVQVCDQTRTNILEGMQPQKAAVQGAKTLMFPMFTGTLTTVAAFLPMLIALSGGNVEYIYSLPVTLSTTLLLSWLFAMTICVLLASSLIKAPKKPDSSAGILPWISEKIEILIDVLLNRHPKAYARRSFLVRLRLMSKRARRSKRDNLFLMLYGRTASVAIRYKWATLATSVAILIAALQLPVASEFFPSDQRDQFYVHITLPETATVRQTDEVVAEVEAAIRKLSLSHDEEGNPIERLRAMRSLTASAGARWNLGVDPLPPEPNTSEILVRTSNPGVTNAMIEDLRRVVDEGDTKLGIEPITGARVTTRRVLMGPPANPVELRITGEGFADIQRLRSIAAEVKAMIREQPGTWDVSDSWGVDGFELEIDVDEEHANLAGVSNANIADTLYANLSGLRLTTFREGDHLVPVYFRVGANQRHELQSISNVYAEGRNGKVPLESIAEVERKWQPVKIERRDLNRTITVSAQVEEGVSGNNVVLDVWNSDRMKELRESLPSEYNIEIGGALEESQDAATEMMFSFGISLLAIILILVVQYNGWSKTLVILVTLPLALIGAFYGLWSTDNPLGFMPQLGLLSLFGIVLNTGIIFIEFADILVREKREELLKRDQATGPIVGLTREQFEECLVSAGKQRMLPIFLTTATTVGGLFPLALSGGPLWEGMSWLMIYGLLVATLLTLYVLPSVYAIVVEKFGIAPIEVN